jgi:hypothetical protein
MVRPRAFAVFRLMTNSNLVGCSTGRSAGLAHQGYDLQLTRYDERGWRATFYTTGMEHSPTSATGTGWEGTPWHATQWAAWDDVRPVAPRPIPPGDPTLVRRRASGTPR